MYVIRVLSAATAFTVVLLEVYSGVIKGPAWWIWPGGLVLALLISLSLYVQDAPKSGAGLVGSTIQLAVILAVAFGMSYFSNYFGRELIPELLMKQGWAPAAG